MLNKIIFAIDDNTDVHAVAKFMRHIDTARAMGNLKGSFVQCIGCYEGQLEPSYMMDERDYRALVDEKHYVEYQDCILHVPADTRQPCTLEYPDEEHRLVLAPMREVTAAEAMQCRAWTYVQATNKYFTTEKV
jgi:hypothetical protein